MKGKLHPTNDVTLNPSGNESILQVIDRIDESRRSFVRTSASASTLAAIGGITVGGLVDAVEAEAAPVVPANGFGGIGFESIPPSRAPVIDRVTVPAGYKVELLAAWGDPVTPMGAPWASDASQGPAQQEHQFGMHNDGMHFFGFPMAGAGRVSSERGLLCVNHEYTHEAILHTDGLNAATGIPSAVVTIAKVRKSQAAHGVSISEVRKVGGRWTLVPNSPFGRRVTANTKMRVSGPAAGHALMKSKKFRIDPAGSVEDGVNSGFEANGTMNNCAHGYTPWGTYLTCEENWNGYFAAPTSGAEIGSEFQDQKAEIVRGQSRYGISNVGFGYAWHTVDPRFNADSNPLEPHLYGWVVEIDPFDPKSTPVKRTALGRMKHESAQVAVGPDMSVGFYMGDDERNEYIYKFVCNRRWNPGNRVANRDLLDDGVLYVARFTSVPVAGKPNVFRGEWIALRPGTIGLDGRALRENPQFAASTDAEVQALILIKTRQAADAVGATMMDRPEWTALRTYSLGGRAADGYSYGPGRPLEVYCTLTNNNRRGGLPASSNNPNGSTNAGSARPPVDASNPRPDNDYGHIIRWREDGNSVRALGFEWDIFVLCGDKDTTKTLGNYDPAGHDGYVGNINGADFGAPDGLWFDHFGRLWIQTDQQGDALGDFTNIGSNTMLCADPNTKEIRRFLTSPPQCEVTGVVTSPDGRTMFCGIQHPGEEATAADPDQFSNWPQSQFATNSAGQPIPQGPSRPRSSVLVITREDGGVIGGL